MKPIAEPSLRRFFGYLRAEGFPGGPGECVRALRIYHASPQAARSDRLKTLLGPVFARSAAEQGRFYDAFDAYFEDSQARPATAAARYADDSPAVHSPTIAAPRPQLPLSTPRLRSRFWLGIAVAWALVLAVVFWLDLPSMLFPPQKIPELDKWNGLMRTYRMVAGTRPCSGFECVVTGPRPWIIAAPLALWVLMLLISSSEWMRTLRTRRRERTFRGPFEFRLPLRLPPPPPSIQNETGAAAAALALPVAAPSQWLDVPATIYETTRAAGFPTPRFRSGRESELYVVAIEERAAADHLAAWLTELAHTLSARNVAIDLYRFRGTAQMCYRAGSDVAIPLERLLASIPGAALLLFGSTRAITDPFTGRVARWASGLLRRGRTILLTPAAPWEWGPPDRELSSLMPMLPARVASLPVAVRLLGSPEAKPDPIRGIDEETPMPPTDLFSEAASGENVDPAVRLRGYMDDAVFRWLCACALYPKLQWELTCRLALVIDHSRKLLEEPSMLALIRLPWFRSGEIPSGWRAALIHCLDDETSKAAQQALLHWLERVPVPAESFAAATHRLHLAAARFRVHPQDLRARAELIAVLKGVSRNDIESDPLIRATVRQLAETTAHDRFWRRLAVWYRQMPQSELASGIVLFLCASAVLTWNIGMPVPYIKMVPERPVETAKAQASPPPVAGAIPPTGLEKAVGAGMRPATTAKATGAAPPSNDKPAKPTLAKKAAPKDAVRPLDVPVLDPKQQANAPNSLNQAVQQQAPADYRKSQVQQEAQQKVDGSNTGNPIGRFVYLFIGGDPKDRAALEEQLRKAGFPVYGAADRLLAAVQNRVPAGAIVGPVDFRSEGLLRDTLARAGFKVVYATTAPAPASAK